MPRCSDGCFSKRSASIVAGVQAECLEQKTRQQIYLKMLMMAMRKVRVKVGLLLSFMLTSDNKPGCHYSSIEGPVQEAYDTRTCIHEFYHQYG